MSVATAAKAASRPPTAQQGTLGTFAGVFTPSVLTILGLILFLRLGFVVGNAGLLVALLVIGLANVISILTSMSLAAIATNLRVKGGGDYYLISRTLGQAFGGAIGILLFLAQSVSIAFYAIGFGEAVASMVTLPPGVDARVIAGFAVGALFLLAWVGADWATRAQFLIMAVLGAALVVFALGAFQRADAGTLAANLEPAGELPFWAIFALFFPAVTGFTQGVSMSGDLRDAGRSIPTGTFLAVGVSMVLYVAFAILFAAAVPGAELVSDYGAMRKVSILPALVDAGVIAATISSALASFLGAPRILQSLAQDRVFPVLSPFAKGHGAAGNPRRGVLLSAVIALAVVGLGSLDLIAPVVSMFFLISYGLLNYATYVEARTNSPSFRPRFRWFDKRLCLLGCAVCLVAILAINAVAGAVAFVFLMAIHQYVTRTGGPERWADSSRSVQFGKIRAGLLAMSTELEHPRDWRPVILAFSDNAQRRQRLLEFAGWIEGRSGLTTVVHIVEGRDARSRKRVREAEVRLRADVRERGLEVLTLAVAMGDSETGFPLLVEAFGAGGLRANTVLLNWAGLDTGLDAHAIADYGRYLRAAVRSHCNVVLLDAQQPDFDRLLATDASARRIDIWWPSDNDTSRLSLLLAYLMTRTPTWEDAKLRLIAVPPDGVAAEAHAEQLGRRLDEYRIEASVVLAEASDQAAVIRHSADASAVFLPFRVRSEGPIASDGNPLEPLLAQLTIVALVLSGEDIALDSEPEGGRHGEIAAALDKEKRRGEVADAAEKDLEKAEATAARAQRELMAAREAGDAVALAEHEATAAEASAELARLRRRAQQRRAKADVAEREAKDATDGPDSDA